MARSGDVRTLSAHSGGPPLRQRQAEARAWYFEFATGHDSKILSALEETAWLGFEKAWQVDRTLGFAYRLRDYPSIWSAVRQWAESVPIHHLTERQWLVSAGHAEMHSWCVFGPPSAQRNYRARVHTVAPFICEDRPSISRTALLEMTVLPSPMFAVSADGAAIEDDDWTLGYRPDRGEKREDAADRLREAFEKRLQEYLDAQDAIYLSSEPFAKSLRTRGASPPERIYWTFLRYQLGYTGSQVADYAARHDVTEQAISSQQQEWAALIGLQL